MTDNPIQLSKFGPKVIPQSPSCELLWYSTTLSAEDLQRQVNNVATAYAAQDLRIDNPVATGMPRHILVTEEGKPIADLRSEIIMTNRQMDSVDVEKLIVEKAGKISPGFYVRIERMPR